MVPSFSQLRYEFFVKIYLQNDFEYLQAFLRYVYYSENTYLLSSFCIRNLVVKKKKFCRTTSKSVV